MSKIGKKGILLDKISCNILNDKIVEIKHKKLFEKYEIKNPFRFYKKDNILFIKTKRILKKKEKMMWGTYRSTINSIISGFRNKFKKKMEIYGIGYSVKEKTKRILEFNVGYTHKVNIKLPKKIKYKIKNNIINIKSYDKSVLGLVCQKIKEIFKKNSYKKKGIFFENEKIYLKKKKSK